MDHERSCKKLEAIETQLHSPEDCMRIKEELKDIIVSFCEKHDAAVVAALHLYGVEDNEFRGCIVLSNLERFGSLLEKIMEVAPDAVKSIIITEGTGTN